MLSRGVYRNVAAQAEGLKQDTVEKWMKRGRGQIKDRPPTPEYVMFVRRVEQTEALARGRVEANIVSRSKYDHNAALAWLRTRYPEQWPRFPGGEEGEDLPPGASVPTHRRWRRRSQCATRPTSWCSTPTSGPSWRRC